MPPFSKHTYSTKNGKKTPYKIGDKKEWNEKVYHYCDCPNHLHSSHWHTHKAKDCRTRKRWLKSKSSNQNDADENLKQENDVYSATATTPDDNGFQLDG